MVVQDFVQLLLVSVSFTLAVVAQGLIQSHKILVVLVAVVLVAVHQVLEQRVLQIQAVVVVLDHEMVDWAQMAALAS
jgi:hypothetical protein